MNLAIDHLRKTSISVIPSSMTCAGAPKGTGCSTPKRDDPSENVSNARVYKTIMDAVDTLPDDQRQVLILRELEDMPYKDIAEILDIPGGTVVGRLYYARRKPRLCLQTIDPTDERRLLDALDARTECSPPGRGWPRLDGGGRGQPRSRCVLTVRSGVPSQPSYPP